MNLEHLKSVLRRGATHVTGHRRYRRFTVLCNLRTGSNLLLQLLRSHPNVCEYGEIFYRMRAEEHRQAWSTVFSKQWPWIRAVGFKLIYDGASKRSRPELWHQVENDRDLHVIHLRRRNKLRMLVSLRIAQQTGYWVRHAHEDSPDVASRCLHIDPVELERDLKNAAEYESDATRRTEGHPLISVYYEDLVSDSADVCAGIFSWLGLQPVLPSTSILRQNVELLPDLLSNFNELREYFRGSPWEHLLTEP